MASRKTIPSDRPLISGVNIKTINGEDVIGQGNIEIKTDLSNYYTREDVNNLNEILDTKIDDTINNVEEVANDLSETQNNVNDISSELQDVEGSLTTAQADINTLESKVSSLESDYSSLLISIENLTNELNSLKSQNEYVDIGTFDIGSISGPNIGKMISLNTKVLTAEEIKAVKINKKVKLILQNYLNVEGITAYLYLNESYENTILSQTLIFGLNNKVDVNLSININTGNKIPITFTTYIDNYVKANPSENGTDNLTKLQIGDTIYNIS